MAWGELVDNWLCSGDALVMKGHDLSAVPMGENGDNKPGLRCKGEMVKSDTCLVKTMSFNLR